MIWIGQGDCGNEILESHVRLHEAGRILFVRNVSRNSSP